MAYCKWLSLPNSADSFASSTRDTIQTSYKCSNCECMCTKTQRDVSWLFFQKAPSFQHAQLQWASKQYQWWHCVGETVCSDRWSVPGSQVPCGMAKCQTERRQKNIAFMLRLLFRMKETSKWRNLKEPLEKLQMVQLACYALPGRGWDRARGHRQGRDRSFFFDSREEGMSVVSVVERVTGPEIALPQCQKNGTAIKEHHARHMAMCLWADHLKTGINHHKDHDYLHKSQMLPPFVRGRVKNPK